MEKPEVVFLDSGHPSRMGDMGKVLTFEGGGELWELGLNSLVEEYAEYLLDVADTAEVVLSKKSIEEIVDLRGRCARARKSGAGLAISIHHNASSNPAYHGMRVFYNNSVAHEVAEVILANAPVGLERRGRVPTHMSEPGWDRVEAVLEAYDDIPAVLVEVGYMTNKKDLALIQQPSTQYAAAVAIVAGVARFLQLKE